MRDTALLDFKKTKSLIDEKLFKAMSDYNPQGARDGDYKAY